MLRGGSRERRPTSSGALALQEGTRARPTQDELSLLDATAAIPPPSGPFHRSRKQPLLELTLEVVIAARHEGRRQAED
jgi:hypothetical protein